MNEDLFLITHDDYQSQLIANCDKTVYRDAAPYGKCSVRLIHRPTGFVGVSSLLRRESDATYQAAIALTLIDAVRKHEGIPDEEFKP